MRLLHRVGSAQLLLWINVPRFYQVVGEVVGMGRGGRLGGVFLIGYTQSSQACWIPPRLEYPYRNRRWLHSSLDRCTAQADVERALKSQSKLLRDDVRGTCANPAIR
jgi:hypothetical protein